MAKRKIALGELAEKVGLTPANLSILKTGKARAIRFSTLETICRELGCQPGDILEYDPEARDDGEGRAEQGPDAGDHAQHHGPGEG